MNVLTKIEIKGLWGTTDIEWNLNSDVNILGGHNGSGKSTILNILKSIIFENDEKYLDFFDEILLTTQTNNFFLKFIDGNLRAIKEKIRNSSLIQLDEQIYQNIESSYKDGNTPITKSSKGIVCRLITNNEIIKIDREQISSFFTSTFISTFEQILVDVNAVKKVYGEDVETNLDLELAKLSKAYTNYRLNLSLKVQKLLETDLIEDIREKQLKIYDFQKRFEQIVNILFSETNKILVYEKDTNKMLFEKDDKKITLYQLSSGEKQLLIILLSTLIQDNKESIILMDEPEVSLHIDWQQKLISYVRELNPNAQLIIVTHSPGLILEKWIDNVTEISQISLSAPLNLF